MVLKTFIGRKKVVPNIGFAQAPKMFVRDSKKARVGGASSSACLFSRTR